MPQTQLTMAPIAQYRLKDRQRCAEHLLCARHCAKCKTSPLQSLPQLHGAFWADTWGAFILWSCVPSSPLPLPSSPAFFLCLQGPLRRGDLFLAGLKPGSHPLNFQENLDLGHHSTCPCRQGYLGPFFQCHACGTYPASLSPAFGIHHCCLSPQCWPPSFLSISSWACTWSSSVDLVPHLWFHPGSIYVLGLCLSSLSLLPLLTLSLAHLAQPGTPPLGESL